MISKITRPGWLVLILSLCLCSAAEAQTASRGTTGGGGGGGGGGFGGGGFGGGGGQSQYRPGGSSSSSSTSSSTRDYNNSTMIGDASVSVDPNTRRVIVITDDETAANVSQIISNLDRPKPQVLIKVVFLEVTHDNELDFGVEGSYTHNPSPSVLNSLQLSNVFGLAGLGSMGQQIGANTMPTGAGLYSVMGSDFSATVRAIASAGKTEVLSRPSILVRNNQPATITVGDSVPLITGTTTTAATTGIPTSTSTINYQNVGVILNVTPFISDAGLVEMIVSPEISSLSSQTITISPGVTAPVINLRSASTVVVTPNGETVIIGGLMENDKVSEDSKIPILGDIPGLGALFRHRQKGSTKTELLIFLTPHIVNLPTQLASATDAETMKADLARKAFTEQELDKFFDTLPLKQPATSGKH